MNEDGDLTNLHQRYVNAERGDEGIPDYFKKRLDNDPRNKLLQEAVFRELWYSDEPIYSIGSLKSQFTEGRQTVGSRLDEMVEQGILEKGSINNGDYWWIDFPNSKHPLPKDVIVHPKPDSEEMTVGEFFSQLHVVLAVAAYLATTFGGGVVLIAAFQMSGSSITPLPTEGLFEIGFLSLFTAYLFLLVAGVAWVVKKAFVPEGESIQTIFTDA